MRRILFLASLCSLLLTSCVTLGKYEAMEAKANQSKKEHNVTRQELLDLQEEYASLQRQFQAQNTDMTDMTTRNLALVDSVNQLRIALGNMRLGVDTLVENYTQTITGQTRRLDKANALLVARTKELNEREKAFSQRENDMLTRQSELQLRQVALESRYAELEKAEEAAKKALASERKVRETKEREIESLRNSVTNALVGFKDKGLNVEVRDGKVYVSMDNKLMFPSASWAVSPQGIQAIKGLAKVLEKNGDINILVQGHTDNDPYRGNSAVKDNWDLSVMRATSIVKLLLQYGTKINPARIEAGGHSEFAPKVKNDTPAHKALNRRTEIILTPNLDALLKAVE